MKFELNIEKKHLYFLSILVLVVGVGVVVAQRVANPTVYHDPLYADTIYSKTADGVVTVDDDLSLTANKVLKTNTIQPATTGSVVVSSPLEVRDGLQAQGGLKTDSIEPIAADGSITIAGMIPKVTTNTFSTGGTITKGLGTHNYCFISGSRTGGDDGGDHQKELCVVDKNSASIDEGNSYEGGGNGKTIFSNLDISEPSAWTLHAKNRDVPDHDTICVVTCFDW